MSEVINIFSKRSEKETKEEKTLDNVADDVYFKKVMEANAAKKSQKDQERAKKNKSVLRSYRIKS
jgi:hypothetical protein